MASLKNSYFKGGTVSEQNLFDTLKQEAIKVMGKTYYYLPRKVQTMDLILGEDILSRFEVAVPIEAYMENVMGFEGDREIFLKFGFSVQNQYKIVISQKRWEQEVGAIHGINMLVGTRPQEGDLLYDPMTKFLFEIKFVDHDNEFYQLGKNYLYYLSCETFQFSDETVTTGVSDIDDLVSILNGNVLEFQLLTEGGDILTLDDCDYPLQEHTIDLVFNKSDEFISASSEMNWSADNPFSGM